MPKDEELSEEANESEIHGKDKVREEKVGIGCGL
jgi:hypothetical protein